MDENGPDTAVPDPARLIRDLVNAYEPQTGHETWTTPAALGSWLTARELVAPGTLLSEQDLTTARTIREGLRGVLLEHAGHAADADALERMRTALTHSAPRLVLGAAGLEVVQGGRRSMDTVIAALLDAVRQSERNGSWERLKACERATCHWAFYDASRNHSRRWCSMAGCGNVLKMRRRAARDTASPTTATGDEPVEPPQG